MGELKPCPFCGSGETRIDENTYWTGMRSIVSSVTLSHWCNPIEDDYVKHSVIIRARTVEQAKETWNGRL